MKRVLALVLLTACGGTTGSALVSFKAMAGGTADVTFPLAFDTAAGYRVTLTRARLRLGAVYLNTSQPSSGAGATSCVLPGIYVAEAFGPVTVDLLSPALQPFPALGEGTQTTATTAEVWLTGGDINAPVDPTVILEVAGVATKAATTFPFAGTVTISSNRAVPVQSPALPGSNPICKERVVTPIAVDLTPTDGGTLTLRIDPRGMFQNVDFASLAPSSSGAVLQIPDAQSGAGAALFKGLVSNAGVYQFTWLQGGTP